jgi:hypothetical protein
MPVVPHGGEYMGVDQTGGFVGASGGKLTYSLPVYGDFLTDMVLATTWSDVSCNAGNLAALPNDLIDLPWDEQGAANLSLADGLVNATKFKYTVDGGTTL